MMFAAELWLSNGPDQSLKVQLSEGGTNGISSREVFVYNMLFKGLKRGVEWRLCWSMTIIYAMLQYNTGFNGCDNISIIGHLPYLTLYLVA